MLAFRPLPSSFSLNNLAHITSRACAQKYSPHGQLIAEEMLQWFIQFRTHSDEKADQAYAGRGRFEKLAALSFADADEEHLKTCLAFLYWAFSTDDITDSGDLQDNPELVQANINICLGAIRDLDSKPTYPYAGMLQDLYKRLRKTATPGACARFVRSVEVFFESEITQVRQRQDHRMLSLEDFVTLRRDTFGAAMIESMIEYALDIDLPDYVFENEIMRAILNTTADMMTWHNDLISFNKEQADNDFQNLICVVMVEHNIELQDAVDRLVDMLDDHVTQYLTLKSRLPSFGPFVDTELMRFLTGLENCIQGAIVWLYRSPRYFSKSDRRIAARNNTLTVNIKPASVSAPGMTANAK